MNPANFEDLTSLIAGDYTCTITDANGCQLVHTKTVTEPAATLAATSVVTDVDCFGNATGEIDITVTDGTGPYNYLWVASNGGSLGVNPANFEDLTSLIAGDYTCTITDANGCVMIEDMFIDEPLSITIPIITTDISCNGGSNGIATATPSGGTGPYTFLWSDVNSTSTPTITGLSNTSYTVTVTDVIGCFSISSTITINEPPLITATGNISHVSCYNGNNGAISLSVSGGNAPYTYLWSNNQTTENATSLNSGTYSVVITDLTGCTPVFSYAVDEPQFPLSASLVISDVLCFGGADGSLAVVPVGGTPPYNYVWPFNGQSSISLTSLSTGTYTCNITDANGCPAFATGTIQQPNDLTLSSSPTSVSCYGLSDGSATVIPQGGIPPYTYNWSNGQASQVDTMLTSGSYNVIVYDSNNCPASDNVFVGQPTQINANFSTQNALCNGDSSGVILVNNTNGSTGPPYTYSWSNGHNSPINQSLSAGIYYLTVTTVDGCSNIFSETITEPLIISASLISSDISVTGANDGLISTSVSGGNPPYIYSWAGPNNFSSSSSSINGLSNGIYSLVIEDANGCQYTYFQVINEPTCSLSIDTTFTTPLCFGDMGEVFWQNSGGLAPYSNTLIDSDGNVIINGAQYDQPSSSLQFPVGVYDLVVTDAAGCNAIWNIPITSPDSIIINYTLTHVSCNGGNNGTASATFSGGTSPYIIDWGAIEPNSLIAGDYNVQVTDINGCSSGIINYTIYEPTQLVIDSVNTTLVSCTPGNDGTATIYASGGILPYSYSWSNGQSVQTAQSLISGIYMAYVFDDNGCMDTLEVLISNAPQLYIIVNSTPISCNGQYDGELVANMVSGSYPLTYSWFDLSNPSVIISSDSIVSNLPSGAYGVTITDINGCTDQSSVSLINSSVITFNLFASNITSNGAGDGSIKYNFNYRRVSPLFVLLDRS